jgi:endonuclease/exonuclease/phosphatase family metal-dependent hydrolase
LVLSRFPFNHTQTFYYFGNPDAIPVFVGGEFNIANKMLLKVVVSKDNRQFTVISTHFTWSPGGTVTQLQKDHMQKVLSFLQKEQEFILCGDFNTPRGNELYGLLATQYRDNIPPDIDTTVDPNLHRVKYLKYVVDGMFSTPGYLFQSVRVRAGVSDHKAIVGVVAYNTAT